MPRLTVEFPEDTNRMLAKLAKDNDNSKREVLRRAIAVYNYLHEHGVKPGGAKRLIIADEKGNLERELLF
ncbi:MAG: hypothetical protein HYV26_13165 [Candidatus Hydrogenedentes bacterium]|nr:hypothetical protein [Candidatus Hydrogenedentota bacterium]